MRDIEDKVEEEKPKTANEKIQAIYEDNAGFGSLAQLISDVKRYYPDIRRADVIKWYNSNVERNIVQRSGYNSYVATKTARRVSNRLIQYESQGRRRIQDGYRRHRYFYKGRYCHSRS